MINKYLSLKQYRLCLLVLLITLQAGIQWSGLPLGNTFLWWLIDFITLFTLFQIRNKSPKYIFVELFLAWTVISTIRGAFIAENYWEWKQLITGFLSLSIPMFVYAFDKPYVTGIVLRYWFKYALLFFILLLPFISNGAYHFYLGPIFVVGCFIPIVPKKWKIIFGILLLTMLVINLGARSQVIKSAIVILVATGIYFKRVIPYILLKIVHWTCYIGPIILLSLGLTGTFNIFEDLSSNQGKYVEKKVVNGQVVEDDLSADTRTFIYVEVIESALRHNYVIWGRTPARGNDSMAFGAYSAEELKTGKYERHGNEVGHLNIFTWLGVIGLILLSFIYIQSSILALYKSNNMYLKYLGILLSFKWAYGWIEEAYSFSIFSISLWLIISICLSKQFRTMTNKQFESYIKNLFRS